MTDDNIARVNLNLDKPTIRAYKRLSQTVGIPYTTLMRELLKVNFSAFAKYKLEITEEARKKSNAAILAAAGLAEESTPIPEMKIDE